MTKSNVKKNCPNKFIPCIIYKKTVENVAKATMIVCSFINRIKSSFPLMVNDDFINLYNLYMNNIQTNILPININIADDANTIKICADVLDSIKTEHVTPFPS